MEMVLVSSCLLGQAVRYNGGDKRCENKILQQWIEEGRIVTICPEVAGGLNVPRLPAEIKYGAGGLNVLIGNAKVFDSGFNDVTEEFVKGAEEAVKLARSKNVRIAILKEGSPSCGTNFIYDGTFSSTKVFDMGVTSASLQQAGIQVFSENQLAEANDLLKQFESQQG